MSRKFKKKAGIILVLPGLGRIEENQILVGDHFAQYLSVLDEITSVPSTAASKHTHYIDVGDLPPEEAHALAKELEQRLQDEMPVPAPAPEEPAAIPEPAPEVVEDHAVPSNSEPTAPKRGRKRKNAS